MRRRYSESTPEWAINFIEEVKDYLGIHHSVKVTWRKRNSAYSSGTFWCNGKGGKMAIRAGSDIIDLKMVICHELTHCKVQGCHTHRFWDWCWKTYRWAGLPLDYCKSREGAYRKNSLAGYKRIIGGKS